MIQEQANKSKHNIIHDYSSQVVKNICCGGGGGWWWWWLGFLLTTNTGSRPTTRMKIIKISK
jgi:hypothetical protein